MDNRDFTVEEFREYVKWLGEQSLEDLEDIWYSNVGEWGASRGDLGKIEDFETWIDEQFEAVKNGEDTEYGYIVGVSRDYLKDILE